MPEFCFIHTADLHLGAPFRGLRVENARVAEAADAATYRAFDRILELALESRAAFVLFAGDVYDAEDANLRAQLRFREGLRRLSEAGIRSFVVHGNHDPLSDARLERDWPEGVHVFPARESAPQVVERGGVPLAAIHGCSYPRREVRESLLPRYRPREEDAGLFRVALLHGNVGGAAGHENYAPCSLAELERAGFDYWALGHVHGHRILRPASPAVVYPGSPQGLSPRETGVHGCCRVTVSGEAVRIEHLPTDSIRWERREVSISGLAGPDALAERIREALEAARDASGCSVVARVTLVGSGPLHAKLRDAGELEQLLSFVRDDVGDEPFVWLERLDPATRPELDLEARRAADDLLGDFLKFCARAREDPELRAELLKALDPLLGRRELRDLLPSPEAGLDEWLERAEALGAELLLAGDAE